MKTNISPTFSHKTGIRERWKFEYLVGVSVNLYDSAISRNRKMLKKLLTEPRYLFAEISFKHTPKQSGVHVIHDEKRDEIIYAGRTKNLKRRLLGDHRRGNIRGSQFRKALGRNFDLKSEDEILDTFLKIVVSSFCLLKTLKKSCGWSTLP